MRTLHFWWRTLVFSTQYNPPDLIELLMVMLAMASLIAWEVMEAWPYLILSSSYAMGAAVLIWVREAMIPSPQRFWRQAIACAVLLILIYSLAKFADLSK